LLKPTNSEQVKDDPILLDQMMNDVLQVSELYRPTNYWSFYEKELLPELKSLGLRNFRRRKNSSLSSFGATDLLPYSQFQRKSSKGKLRILNFLIKLALKDENTRKILSKISKANLGVNYSDINHLCYEFAKNYGKNTTAKPLDNFEASLVGNPEDTFQVNGKLYTPSLLYYYIMYAYCSNFINFDSVNTMMEIGSGAGKQIEVIKKLHPQINFFVFDIPPQLYVCERYLSTLFPDSVVSYKETRKMKKIPTENNGKIFIFGNWQIEEIENFNYDIFWNSASFQEMEPNVVLNYLKFVNKQTKNYIFLLELMKGKEIATVKGSPGVIEQTKLDHYKTGLKDFHIKDFSDAFMVPNLSASAGYKFSFWERMR